VTPSFVRADADGAISAADLGLLRGILLSGGVVAAPAESCYGLSAFADSGEGISRIAKLKGSRPRSFIVAIGERAQLAPLGIVAPGRLIDLLFEIWPAPVSFVLPIRGRLAADAAGSGSLALRLPSDPVLRSLARGVGAALVTTSANREGERPARSTREIATIWSEGLDAIVDGGERSGGPPSTVVDLAGEPGRILRPGAWIPSPELLAELSTAAAENPTEDHP
jgi:L-threonylcarbamoyladenylate synthase